MFYILSDPVYTKTTFALKRLNIQDKGAPTFQNPSVSQASLVVQITHLKH